MLPIQALVKFLEDDADVGAIAGDKIFPFHLPQDVVHPAIVIRSIDYNSVERLESRGLSGLALFQYRIGSVARSPSTAILLDEAVRLCLVGRNETVTGDDSPVTTIEIKKIRKTTHRDFYDDPTKTYWLVSEYDVWAAEAVPS